MGDRAKGKDKGSKKKPKAVKPGNRPHELQQQGRTTVPGSTAPRDKEE
jgi:hypothetical protein